MRRPEGRIAPEGFLRTADVRCSVVVPAHNEAGVLADRVGGLLAVLPPGAAEVVVVANGCTDDTAEVARGLPGTTVVVVPEASKTAALNAGDRSATLFPRVYLDADIRLSGAALTRLVQALQTDRPVAAAPRVHFDLAGCSWPVRAFFAVFRRLPYTNDGLVGLGVYGLSESARRRFDRFPDVVADDLYIQRLFSEEERITVDATFEVVAPRTLRALLRVRTRVARGNAELAACAPALGLCPRSTSSGTARALARVIGRDPALVPAGLVYLAVTAVARFRARRTTGRAGWERDDSSRTVLSRQPLALASRDDR